MGNKITGYVGAVAIFSCVALSPKGTKPPLPPQQERQYTISIPARLVNAHLMLVRGQLEQLTARDFRELQDIEEPQIYAQYRQYAYADSVAQAMQRAVKDTSKIKKP